MSEAKDQGRRLRKPEASGVLGLPLKRLRAILHVCHLTFGMLLMPYIYSPLREIAVFEWVVRIVLFPLSVVTGIAMWQQAKLRKLLASAYSG